MKTKKIIIVLSILLIGIIILLSFLLTTLNRDNEPKNSDVNDNDELFEGDSYTDETQKVEDANIFYSVSYCIQKYYNNKYINYDTYDDEMINDQKSNLYNILDKNYIEKNNITKDNVLENVGIEKNQLEYIATEMNSVVGAEYSIYAVKGLIMNSETNSYIGEEFYKVIVNSANTTYSIIPIKAEDNMELSKINLSINELKPITENDDNKFIITSVNYSSLIKRYMIYYRNMALNYPQIAYQLLDEEYREKKFNNIGEFKEYIDNHKHILENLMLDQYQITNYDNYTQYIAIDTKGNYYIFKENGIMNFKIILDTYTIDLKEFIDKYDVADEQTKVGINVNKIINAINDKDYEYIYQKMDGTFKGNKFGNIETFKNYVENNFYQNNNIEFIEFSKEGDTYIYKTKITDKETDNSTAKEFVIIMKLLENRDFVMSFSINDY